jgi:alkylation response protein AidB-like acyl-CoA dehydrogenase
MELELTSDQQLFQDTTRRFIDAGCPVDAVRELRHSPTGFDHEYWRRGAQLGWTSLLVDDDDGGGSISGRGLIDLTLIAHEFGRQAAPGPLLATNVAAAALTRSGSDEQKAAVLPGILSGEGIASWAHAEPGQPRRFGQVRLEAAHRNRDYVLTGVKEPVEAGAQAGHLLVSARASGGVVQFLVPVDTPGVTVHPLRSLDLTRRFARVVFDGARVPATAMIVGPTGADDDIEYLLQVGLSVQLAETAGAMGAAFAMTVEWAFNRYSFGRPLASYQELKHRFADMKTWLEASYAVSARAARSVQDGDERAGEWVSVAKSYLGQYGPELAQDCVQIHGGIGVTFDHDMHLFLRRITVNRADLGSPTEHRNRLVAILESRLAMTEEAS